MVVWLNGLGVRLQSASNSVRLRGLLQWCELFKPGRRSFHSHQLWALSIEAMQRTFNPWNRGQYPDGLLCTCTGRLDGYLKLLTV